MNQRTDYRFLGPHHTDFPGIEKWIDAVGAVKTTTDNIDGDIYTIPQPQGIDTERIRAVAKEMGVTCRLERLGEKMENYFFHTDRCSLDFYYTSTYVLESPTPQKINANFEQAAFLPPINWKFWRLDEDKFEFQVRGQGEPSCILRLMRMRVGRVKKIVGGPEWKAAKPFPPPCENDTRRQKQNFMTGWDEKEVDIVDVHPDDHYLFTPNQPTNTSKGKLNAVTSLKIGPDTSEKEEKRIIQLRNKLAKSMGIRERQAIRKMNRDRRGYAPRYTKYRRYRR